MAITEMEGPNLLPIRFEGREVTFLSRILPFTMLALITILGFLLLASNAYGWTASDEFYHAVFSIRASASLTIQVIIYGLGLIQVSVVCRLLNHGTRPRMKEGPSTLNMIHLWTNLSALRIDWSDRLWNLVQLSLQLLSPLPCGSVL